MKLYCMCEAQRGLGDVKRAAPDGQVHGAPNRYAALRPNDTDEFPPVMLQTAMRVLKIGVRQVLTFDGQVPPNVWDESKGRPKYDKEHYPNVDVHECPHCHARVVLEG